MPPRQKPKTGTAAAAPPSIEDLFTTLNGHIENDRLSQVVKVADQILSIAPGDEDAMRCKVAALVKDETFDDALKVIQSSNRSLINFGFFKAYCLYRQNKLNEALESLQGIEKNTETLVLESQIHFRMGKFDACIKIYQGLQKSGIKSIDLNHVAGLVLAGRASEVQGMMEANRIKANNSFELAYNVACSLIERNKYSDAENHLLAARRMGQEQLMEESLTEDAIEAELAPIDVQLAYVQQVLGRSQESFEAYIDIINKNPADEKSVAVAVNNLVALRGSKDVSDSLRKLDRLKEQDSQNFRLSRGLDRLPAKQKEAIYANRVLLLLHANKMDQARELVAALPEMFPDSVVPVLLQAGLFVRENKANKAEEILAKFAETFPEKFKTVLLARAQVAAAAGHHQVAADSLSKIPDIQHMPATVATLVALKERAGDIDGASAVLDSALRWWSNAMTEDNKLTVIMQEAASFKLRHGREEEASGLFEELVKTHGSIEALVGLVTTVAHVNIDKAETYEKKLKPLPGLKGIDVDSLEKTSGAKPVEGISLVAESREEVKKEKPKKKRKRKPKYPKGFDPANPGPPPDPERWLPKRERSTYRPKRKDKRAAQVRGSQGAVVREKPDAGASGLGPNASGSHSSQTSTSKVASQNAASEKPKSKSSRKKSRN